MNKEEYIKIAIFLNGELDDIKCIKKIVDSKKYEYIIAGDGGINHLYDLKIKPDYMIGDMDSAKPEIASYYIRKGVKHKVYPTKKDETDAELCIYLAENLSKKRGLKLKLDIYAALGGRTDHLMANINMLYYIQKKSIIPTIISEDMEINIVENASLLLRKTIGTIVSVIPIKDDAKGVTLEGFEYPLQDYFMEFGKPLGISNIINNKKSRVTVKEGCLIVMINKKED